jgi:glyoxylase I family protein
MSLRVDHIVFWVADPLRSAEFYERVLGLEILRLAEFRAGKAPFPSVRISGDSLIDLMSIAAAPMLNALPGAEGSAGNKVNHLCLAMSKEEYAAMLGRLNAHKVAVPVTMKNSFGAQGQAPEAIYFADPDGNVLEARYYA